MNLVEIVARRVKRVFRLGDNSRLVCAIRPTYDSMLERLYGRRGLSRTIHGEEPLRLLPCTRLIPEEYEPQALDALKETLGPGAVVLDVGANVGISAMMMARWCGSEGHIYAFEPSPTPKKLLAQHLQLNGLADRVTISDFALSDAEGTATFYASGISGKAALSDVNIGQDSEAVKVPVTTIDAYCETNKIKPSLIKIDVEGFEFKVLNGARKTLKEARPRILVELHPMFWPALGIDTEWAARQLRELNYRITPIERQSDVMSEHGHIMLQPA
jgi:FkbM family methyltransferase